MREYSVHNFLQQTFDEDILPENDDTFLILKLYIENDVLKDRYRTHIENHNKKIIGNQFPDSGFNLLFPEKTTFEPVINSKFVDLGIVAQMIFFPSIFYSFNQDKMLYCPFQIYSRSSISKTPLLLANNVGIIDSSYRGNLITAIRNLDTKPFVVEQYQSVCQVCHPSLSPILVVLVDREEILMDTSRGTGGFGSTM
jgi:dUTP pyrophosphatase